MSKLVLLLIVLIFTYCKLVNLASILSQKGPQSSIVIASNSMENSRPSGTQIDIPFSSQPPQPTPSTPTKPGAGNTVPLSSGSSTTSPTTTTPSSASPSATTTSQLPSTTTTVDPNSDPEDLPQPGPPPVSTQAPSGNASKPQDVPSNTNKTKQTAPATEHPGRLKENQLEWSILFYSVFIVYVSFVKLIYHNINWIKNNMTEPGILMIFGIVWESIVRQISSNYDAFPRFNSRIFFYLFLPSTVLESASLLSNKWLLFNLLPILTHSILGTILHAVSFGFTMYSMGQANLFAVNVTQEGGSLMEMNSSGGGQAAQTTTSTPHLPASAAPPLPWSMESHNVTMTDCLMFGTILASIDASPMLNVFRHYQVNEKLYYLVLGENLMNNAVVIVLFNLFLEYFETKKLTMIKVYFAILQFFATLIGGVFIGLLLAAFTLICVRLTRRFQVPDALSSYQNQCQAMVETLLILKLAYLTYTLANLAGTSSIVSLATFGILNDQYIKQNLNLRSQLTFKQVILATKTMGFSLVYPLLGMLLVEVASNGSVYLPSQPMAANGGAQLQTSPIFEEVYQYQSQKTSVVDRVVISTSIATDRISSLAQRANQNWNFKFLSAVTILTICYRFMIVITLGIMGNLLTCGQMKIKFREQILMAYGGLKGPLAIALVHRLLEHEDHKHRIAHNRHLFIYTVLSITLISTALVGSFIRPLVARVQASLIAGSSNSRRAPVAGADARATKSLEQMVSDIYEQKHGIAHISDHRLPTILFDRVNCKLTEYVSHGLNSILGHSRSPYDKFAEFNETHIKPWLARAGSNTNWLSVFYDNLVLDETLNANCFYVATEDPTTLRTLFATSQQFEHLNLNDSFQVVGARKEAPLGPGAGKRALQLEVRKSQSVKREPKLGIGQFSAILSKIEGDDYRRASETLLREFVLLNLKMENSRRRRRQVPPAALEAAQIPRQPKAGRRSLESKSLDAQEEERKEEEDQERQGEAMISSTSSSMLRPANSKEFNNIKRRQLTRLADRLGAPDDGSDRVARLGGQRAAVAEYGQQTGVKSRLDAPRQIVHNAERRRRRHIQRPDGQTSGYSRRRNSGDLSRRRIYPK